MNQNLFGWVQPVEEEYHHAITKFQEIWDKLYAALDESNILEDIVVETKAKLEEISVTLVRSIFGEDFTTAPKPEAETPSENESEGSEGGEPNAA